MGRRRRQFGSGQNQLVQLPSSPWSFELRHARLRRGGRSTAHNGHISLNLAQLEVPVQQIRTVLFVQAVFSKLTAQRDVSNLKKLGPDLDPSYTPARSNIRQAYVVQFCQS